MLPISKQTLGSVVRWHFMWIAVQHVMRCRKSEHWRVVGNVWRINLGFLIMYVSEFRVLLLGELLRSWMSSEASLLNLAKQRAVCHAIWSSAWRKFPRLFGGKECYCFEAFLEHSCGLIPSLLTYWQEPKAGRWSELCPKSSEKVVRKSLLITFHPQYLFVDLKQNWCQAIFGTSYIRYTQISRLWIRPAGIQAEWKIPTCVQSYKLALFCQWLYAVYYVHRVSLGLNMNVSHLLNSTNGRLHKDLS